MTDRLPRTQLRVLLAIMALRASAPPADPITCRSLALACGLRSIGHLHAVLAGLRARGLIARLCDCCRNTVKWWVDHGLLPSRQGTDPFQGARATLVRREDLEAFLKARGMPDFLDP